MVDINVKERLQQSKVAENNKNCKSVSLKKGMNVSGKNCNPQVNWKIDKGVQ
jgi:hypothetical protein